MRKSALALLLASAITAAPASAVVQDHEPRAERSERAQSRAERRQARQESREARREQQAAASERRSQERSVVAPAAPRQAESSGDARSIVAPGRARLRQQGVEAPAARAQRQPVIERLRERSRESRRANVESRGPDALRSVAPDASVAVETSGDSVRDWRREERRRAASPASIEERNLRRAPRTPRSGEALVQPERALPPVLEQGRRRVSRTPVPGTEPPEPATASRWRDDDRHRWSHDWRRDRRYDWRDHRRRHRSRFHLGFYYDPFGWRYHRYGIGWRLWPAYYGNRFWLNDPWMYRLPPAHGPYRWIRYYDDALLVNIYTGRVVDVIHNFFW